ncbi:MAG TPA: HAD family hydrolase [Methylomirabilota bacterium]|jgi:FMN phosphatase YigB (HAD superfamily)|nr:HAD family hydrolase [Methylomirabilota bacterium]
MARYTTVLFDMFDTLVRFNRDRLPLARLNGREVHSSVACLYPVAAPALPGVTIEAFYDAFVASYRDAEARRGPEHREVPALERFGFCYARLGVDPAAMPRELTERLIGLHASCLAVAAEPLPGRPELLDWLAGRYRLGLVSNFDYTPTVRRILAEGGILDRFDAVVVSDGVGWRKPSPRIYEAAFRALGVGAAECLFIGDRPEIDVAGAKGIGMPVAWFNPEGALFPEGVLAPDFILARLADLRSILEGPSGEGAG